MYRRSRACPGWQKCACWVRLCVLYPICTGLVGEVEGEGCWTARVAHKATIAFLSFVAGGVSWEAPSTRSFPSPLPLSATLLLRGDMQLQPK